MDTGSLRSRRANGRTRRRRPPAARAPPLRQARAGSAARPAAGSPAGAGEAGSVRERYVRIAPRSPPCVNAQEGKAERTDRDDPFGGASPRSSARAVRWRAQSGTTSAAVRSSTAPVLRRDPDGETLPPLLAAGRKHGPAPARLHAVPETMLVRAFAVVRTIRRSHGSCLQKAAKRTWARRQRSRLTFPHTGRTFGRP